MTRYAMVIDVTRCDGCYNCFIVCKDEYCDQAKPGYSAPQPMTGQHWMKIIPVERGTVPQSQAGLHRAALHAVRGCPSVQPARTGPSTSVTTASS